MGLLSTLIQYQKKYFKKIPKQMFNLFLIHFHFLKLAQNLEKVYFFCKVS